MIWTIIGKARDSQGGGKNQTNKQSIFNELQVHSTALWLSFSCMALDSRPASLLQMESHQKDWFFVPHRKVKKTSLNNYILGKIKKKKKKWEKLFSSWAALAMVWKQVPVQSQAKRSSKSGKEMIVFLCSGHRMDKVQERQRIYLIPAG